MLITMNTDTTKPKPKSFKQLLTKKQRKPMGRVKGAHLTPIDMKQFIIEHNCNQLFVEHPWLLDVKLYENTLMRDTLARTVTKKAKQDSSKWSIELARKVVNNTVDVQREVFIKAACNLIAIKMFAYYGQGQAYQLLLERYNGERKQDLQYVEPETGKARMIAPEAVAVKH